MLSKTDQETFVSVAALFVLAVFNGYFFNWLSDRYFPCQVQENGLGEFSISGKLALLVIVAPFLETYLFQHLPQQILTTLKISATLWRVVLPALLFGAIHPYCWAFAVMAFFGGVLLNMVYLYTQQRTTYYFFIVVAFHACYNLYGFLFVV